MIINDVIIISKLKSNKLIKSCTRLIDGSYYVPSAIYNRIYDKVNYRRVGGNRNK